MGHSGQSGLKHPFCQISIIYCIFQQQSDTRWWLDSRVSDRGSVYFYQTAADVQQLLQLSYSRQFTAVHTHSGNGDLWPSSKKITIRSVSCPTTSKHQAELIDVKTFTRPTGRTGCLLSRVWTSPVPHQAFATNSHTKLSFPECTSPPERCHWGLWHTSGGLKMFLTDWPLLLFPEVTLVTLLSFM